MCDFLEEIQIVKQSVLKLWRRNREREKEKEK